ncbi:hypothetical protein A9Q84_14945 [Halobacteriovorax marinus]|uniref:ABC transporter substrate-binding protein n=1 Tax=Halobacteriovorax marinus TaxID=97084 RepID=A0A1Y5FBL3_9BACT|nr:hypothetical protein A9Q84_14945 [Halobacteriovorax marinus]
MNLNKFFLLLVFVFLSGKSYSSETLEFGIIDSQSSEPYSTIRKHLYSRLSEKGYDLGKNLITHEFAIGNRKGVVKNIWKYYFKGKIDIAYVSGTLATIGAKEIFEGKPINVIFAAPTDPVGIGVIKGFNQKPYANFTGISYPVKVSKRLRFVRELIPNLKRIGYIYSDMPQSLSYLGWLKTAMKLPEFRDIKLILRKVPFIPSEGGHMRMAKLAKKYVLELNDQVDVFLSPNDQMGTQKAFAQMVFSNSKKPLIGVGRKDVNESWGATASLYPSLLNIGYVAADMILKLAKRKSLKSILPTQPKEGITIDKKLAKKFNLKIPKKYRKFYFSSAY